MKSTGRLVAILLLLTVFFIRMASELLGYGVGINRYFVLLLGIFCVSLLLWLASLVWLDSHNGTLPLFAATFGLFFIAMEFFYSYNMDLIAVFTAFVLFTVSLGRGGNNSGGEQVRSTMSTYTVAGVTSTDAPVSVVRDYSPPSEEIEIETGIVSETVEVKESTESDAAFVASKRGKYYHKAGSDWAVKIKAANRRDFSTKEAAWEAGFHPHRDIN